ncbi:hypothetical protein ISCGN_031230 [Ixodes scapularis]
MEKFAIFKYFSLHSVLTNKKEEEDEKAWPRIKKKCSDREWMTDESARNLGIKEAAPAVVGAANNVCFIDFGSLFSRGDHLRVLVVVRCLRVFRLGCVSDMSVLSFLHPAVRRFLIRFSFQGSRPHILQKAGACLTYSLSSEPLE